MTKPVIDNLLIARIVAEIGDLLATKIREIIDTGDSEYHRNLSAEVPPTMLELLRLQGVGPKTVALLHAQLGIQSLDELEAAARSGQLRQLRGMGAKKEALIVSALAERRQHGGRHLLADMHGIATGLVDHLRSESPSTEFLPVGFVPIVVEPF